MASHSPPQNIIDAACKIYDVSRMSDFESEDDRDGECPMQRDDVRHFSFTAACFYAGIASATGCMLAIARVVGSVG